MRPHCEGSSWFQSNGTILELDSSATVIANGEGSKWP